MESVLLTIDEVKKQPQNFFYIFASDTKFLPYIDKKHRLIIYTKKVNQYSILNKSAKKYGKDITEYQQAVYDSFISTYGMTPAKALVTLANGGSVAGKNWAAGVYGVGAIRNTDFIQDPSITINTTTGEIMKNGVVVSSADSAIYGRSGKKTVVTNYSYTDGDKTYTSQRIGSKYYAGSYSSGDIMQDSNGKDINGSSSSSIWENIALGLQDFVSWLMNLFGIDTTVDNPYTEANTVPSQTQDGFVSGSESEMSWSTIGLMVMGGTLIATGAFSKFWNGVLDKGKGKGKKRK